MIFIHIVAAWFFADFVTGIFHWWEDRYLDESQSLEFFRGVATDNEQHHEKPTAMLLSTYWENMRSAAIFAAPVSAVLFWCGVPVWLWLGIGLTSFGNLIHRFSHTPKRQLPGWIRLLQRLGIFISHEHHDTHHRHENGRLVIPKWHASIAYCPMTNWVNPVLDFVHFWDGCEYVLRLFGIRTLT